MTLDDILADFRRLAPDERAKGAMFERFVARVLMADPLYADRLERVWMWGEWPHRWGGDDGIDLVAQERDTGDFWAIQCKFYDPDHTIQKADIDSFFTASGKHFQTPEGERHFAHRLIVSTTDKWSSKAEEALSHQTIPVARLFIRDLADSPIDWSRFSLTHLESMPLKEKKTLRAHQVEAMEAVLAGFEEHDRGKLIMACGTGKTLTSLRLAEHMTPETGRILFLAPSISLVSQTLREWTAQAEQPIHAYVVCSDTKVGKDEEDIRTHDLAYPATTDAAKLASAIQKAAAGRRTVIFSTYQSIQVVADAQAEHGVGEFDLIICDEAHRTTGVSLKKEELSDFVKVHQNDKVRGRKRLYMTATPRIYAEVSKTKARENDVPLFSMDDPAIFGPEFYRLGFGKAVDRGLLAEYKVLIVAVEEDRMAALANSYNAFKIGDKKAIDIAFATKIIGSWKGLSKMGLKEIDENEEHDYQDDCLDDHSQSPMRRAVAFSRSIKDSKQITEVFSELVDIYLRDHGAPEVNPEVNPNSAGLVKCHLQHVDGGMNALQRQVALEWLKDDPGSNQCRILSNARCLSEGIDVPALDAVVFFDTRESIVDIVQSVGRVMRKSEGKRFGYIILPVGIPSAKIKDYNSYIESDPQFKGIWKVLKALRAHDERLVDEAEFRRKIKTIGEPRGQGEDGGERGGEQITLDFPVLPLDAINEAVYAAIPKKLGDREYWSEWAKSIKGVAERLIARIHSLIETHPAMAQEFDVFLKGLRDTLNPSVTEDDAIEMLAQHILTLPVFQALFAETGFPEHNAVGRDLQRVVDKLDAAFVASETEGLEKFYANVSERIRLAKSDKSKQEIIRNLYDTFFHNAFPRMADRLGIVYTPIPVVDFILHSVQDALEKHFGSSLSAPGVQILDPFSGTGTFMVRLIQSGLFDTESLIYKFDHELHANELVLLAYYIATVNIETAFHAQTGIYKPFDGMVLTDTFQMTEENDLVDRVVLPTNNERAERQKRQPIRVIIGNPPYSAGQESENDNNKNANYPTLDKRIRDTYGARSKATLIKNLYDSYIRAIRWASDRIQDQGIVAYVTNGSFLEANNMDGLRKSLAEEFSALYVFNLRGNQRTSGEKSRQEGGKIFGEGSRTPVAITLMIKDPKYQGPCEINYYDIGDYLSREEKLHIIEQFKSIANIPWRQIIPNEAGDWAHQRDPLFETFIPLGDKKDEAQSIFDIYSLGVVTNRDAWTYNMDREALESHVKDMIRAYEHDRNIYALRCAHLPKEQWPEVEEIIHTDPKEISWTANLKNDVKRNKPLIWEPDSVTQAMYRPFQKQWLYFNRRLNERVYQMPRLFPTNGYENTVIAVAGIGANTPFSALASSVIPDLSLVSVSQCFPLYWYETEEEAKKRLNQASSGQLDMLEEMDIGQPDENGYIRREAISDWALDTFRAHYGDQEITKEDIFWYVYGLLHSPEYRERFATNLKLMLPRLPFAQDFWAFAQAGCALGQWHLNYEEVEPWPLEEVQKSGGQDWRVKKMRFPSKADKSTIIYNDHLTLRGIPEEAYAYVVNGKSAIEWVMDRYQVTTDKDSGLVNDPNQWSDNPRYIVDLVKKVTRVSVESARIIENLPKLGIA